VLPLPAEFALPAEFPFPFPLPAEFPDPLSKECHFQIIRYPAKGAVDV
jgi:hypothetical protein